MSSANLELVRSICSAWGRGEFGRTAEWAHPEIEFVVADGPEPGSWFGLAGAQEGGRAILGPFEDGRVEPEQYREVDGERILVFVHNSGRGKTSGMELREMQTRAANLFHIRDGKVTRLVAYWDREHALADLGLAPEAS